MNKVLSDKAYNILKWQVLVFIPAFTTFYGVVANTLGIPCTDIVLTILIAFDTFLGSLIGVSTVNYNKGENKDEVL